MTTGRVVALGAYLLDVLGYPIDAVPATDHGELVDEITLTVAGAAGATAVDLAKLGVEVTAVGAVGDDAGADFLDVALQRGGVDTRGLVRQPGLRTAASILPVRADGTRGVWHMRAAMNRLTPEDVAWLDFAEVDVLHVGGPDALGRFAGEPLLELVHRARDRGTRVTVDLLGPAGARELERLTPLFALVDDFMPNDAQLRGLTGHDDLAAAAEVVLGLGLGCVFVTRGRDGSTIYTANGPHLGEDVPALDVAVVDSTGCGDAYSAGVVLGRLLGLDTSRVGLLGAVTGGLVAEGLGSDAGIVDLDSTLARLADLETADSHS